MCWVVCRGRGTFKGCVGILQGVGGVYKGWGNFPGGLVPFAGVGGICRGPE